MSRVPLVLALGLLCGCGDAVWVPAVGLPWWDEESQVPAEHIDGDCTVTLTEVVVGLPEVGLLGDGEPAFAPPDVALDLSLGVTTLGEVRVPARGTYETVSLLQGPVAAATGSAADGTASEEQREFSDGGTLALTVVCGEESASWRVPIPTTAVSCVVPASLEIDAQTSFGTLAVFDPVVLLGGGPLDGAALLAAAPVLAGNGWSNIEGTACAE